MTIFLERLLYGIFLIAGSVPLRVLYIVADVIAFVMNHVLRYRRRVVMENLCTSFPEKSSTEIKEIRNGFYKFLADYFMETLKMSRLSSKEMKKRMMFEGIEDVARTLQEGRSVTLYLGHYCNWEWVSSLPLYFPDGIKSAEIYHPLENRVSDAAFLRLRRRYGAIAIPMNDTMRVLKGWYMDGIPSVTGYISDQVPGYNSIHLWVDFLNHDTPVFSGPERISRLLNAEVYYIDMFRPKRGYYIGKFVKMSCNASQEEKFSLTRHYFKLLEESILRSPQYWLWSHRRWKRTREGFEKEYPDAALRQSRLSRL